MSNRYRQLILASKPVLYLVGGEAGPTGSAVQDWSHNRANALLQASTPPSRVGVPAPHNLGRGLDPGGSTNYRLEAPNNAIYASSQTMSWEAWILNYSVPSGGSNVFNRGNNPDGFGNRAWDVIIEATTLVPKMFMFFGTGLFEPKSTTVITLNKWHHLATTYDGAFVRFYLDGNFINEVARTGTPNNSNSRPIYIGARLGTNACTLNGAVCHAAFYNETVLSPSDIGKRWAIGKSGLALPVAA
jgi:hypothetical protein